MPDISLSDWSSLQEWWQAMGRRLQVEDRVEAFFRRAMGVSQALAGVVQVGGEVEYILFVLVHWRSISTSRLRVTYTMLVLIPSCKLPSYRNLFLLVGSVNHCL
jgi:uncharacterized protein (DUF2236 family)